MGQVKPLLRSLPRTYPKVWNGRGTMHEQDYIRVLNAIQTARAEMLPGQTCIETHCPICGGTAYVLSYEGNQNTCIAWCDQHCFAAFE
jgi:hypothetical protein